ncbi:MAG TPA: DUF512 domain-containing protein [Bacillota bacterium]|nr:DUF512 domain-containing protein [Bacillota bacterium]HPT87090.1 DUF512 domain-containing protein [Bacillota bacterium]
MVKSVGAVIREVMPGSIADELELEPGDRLLRLNGQPLDDFIRFLTLSSEPEIELELEKKSGMIEVVEFEKDPDEPLGLSFEGLIYDGIRVCKNNCLFCFVHQLPKGQRPTLYVKDDDYRLSFLQGCYITLTNLTEKDWRRIEELHLSPLYVSVHATDPEVRCRLIGSPKAGEILAQLRRLVEAGIMVHTQAVLCPGINDGEVLERTIDDLAALAPGVASLAVVPVGLTAHRERLFPLKGFNKDEAANVLKIVHRFQQELLPKLETRFVFAADEWYLAAEEPLPQETAYEGYPQLDNGVGLLRWFYSEFEETFEELLPKLRKVHLQLTVVTGRSARGLWQDIAERFAKDCPGIRLSVLPVTNRFFGETVTVAGLLVGKDLIEAIREYPDDSGLFLIPQITLKQDEAVFLDGTSLDELMRACEPRRIAVVPTRAADWLTWILEEGCVNLCHEQ